MAITKEQIIYGFTARWSDDGVFQGAHIEYREVVKEDGEVIASKYLPARPVGDAGEPFGPIFDALNTASLAAIEAKDAEIAALKEEKTASDAANDAANSALAEAQAAHTAEVAALQAQLAALAPPADINGVPQQVPRRQAKTIMELMPNATHGDLWQAALAAANAIEDRAARIVTVNYLLESLYFEHPKVSQLAMGLLGMTQDQVDALFVEAAKL